MLKNNKGFSLVEILVVIAIFSALIGFTVINLFGSSEKANTATSIETLISDIKLQQQKAMSGEEGTAISYGIYFSSQSYTLFKGDTFNISEPSNASIDLSNNVRFSNVDFADSVLVFRYGSGEVFNFNGALNSITIENTADNTQKKIYTNKYGVISIQ